MLNTEKIEKIIKKFGGDTKKLKTNLESERLDMLMDMSFGVGGGMWGGTAIPLLQDTPIASGQGYVYVPDELVDQFKEHEVFMEYANQILPKSQLA